MRKFGLSLILVIFPLLSAQAQFQSPDAYSARRDAVYDAIGDGIAIVPGSEGDGDHVARQRSHLLYLAGAEEPNAYLVLDGKARRSYLFVPSRTQFAPGQFPTADRDAYREAAWNKVLRRLQPGTAAADETGLDNVLPLDDFWEVVKPLASRANRIFVDYDAAEIWAPAPLGPTHSSSWQVAAAMRKAIPETDIENLAPLLHEMRLIKDVEEIEAMQRSAFITAEGINEIMRTLRPGQTEREIAGYLEYIWKKIGAQRVNFDSIVQTGPNSMIFYPLAWEKYDSYTRTTESGDLLFLDVGAEFDFYAADLCRTIPVSGKYTAVQRKYYDMVLEASDAAIAATRPGVEMLDVVRAAAAVFKKYGLDQYEDVSALGEDNVWGILPSPSHYINDGGGMIRGIRGLGHQIGLAAIDRSEPNPVLRPGMVFTVEPKLYVTEYGFGIMLEDEVLVTEDGARVLSLHSPRTADAIEAMMRSAGSQK